MKKIFYLIVSMCLMLALASCADNFRKGFVYTPVDSIPEVDSTIERAGLDIERYSALFDFIDDEFSFDTYVIYADKKAVNTDIRRNACYTYFSLFGEDKVPTNFRMVFNYAKDGTPLEIDHIIFNIDGDLYKVRFDGQKEMGAATAAISYENIDLIVDDVGENLIYAISNADKVSVKVVGRMFQRIRELRKEEIEGIAYTYLYYKELGGVF